MNYPITKELIAVIAPFVDENRLKISTKNADWRGREYTSDYVILDEQNGVAFEVFEKEITVFYFSEHHHFGEYSSDPNMNEQDYTERAKQFLQDLFSCVITQQKNYKGSFLTSEKTVFTYPDGTTDCPAGIVIHNIIMQLVPFLPKRTETMLWQFDKTTGCFERA